jgi:3-dehydroquinate dehydratase-2
VSQTGRFSVLVLNGPNLGALGRRDPALYGSLSHDELADRISKWADSLGIDVETEQYDSEGDFISAIWRASGKRDALIVNPGGYAHGSIPIMDAMDGFDGPVIEVHLSQVMSREPERRVLVTARAADVLICGAGPAGYGLALQLVPDMAPKRV